ncbi:hypothetical protein [Thermococcus sp.]|uniref:hypothetical protein n=1 Tax=Thermococcus sp. TaxID=35749 RepID=UPI002624DA3E|nr:hypothetical protein [Thermococcus sp.]
MTKIRPQTLVAGLAGKATPMNNIGAKGFYIQSVGARWWVKKSGAILANLPYTIESPHLGQIETRLEFAKIASATKGMPLAERLRRISEEMRGYRAPDAMKPEEYPSRVKKSYHTVAELEAMLRAKKGEEYGTYKAGEFFRGAGL